MRELTVKDAINEALFAPKPKVRNKKGTITAFLMRLFS